MISFIKVVCVLLTVIILTSCVAFIETEYYIPVGKGGYSDNVCSGGPHNRYSFGVGSDVELTIFPEFINNNLDLKVHVAITIPEGVSVQFQNSAIEIKTDGDEEKYFFEIKDIESIAYKRNSKGEPYNGKKEKYLPLDILEGATIVNNFFFFEEYRVNRNYRFSIIIEGLNEKNFTITLPDININDRLVESQDIPIEYRKEVVSYNFRC